MEIQNEAVEFEENMPLKVFRKGNLIAFRESAIKLPRQCLIHSQCERTQILMLFEVELFHMTLDYT